MIDALKDGSRDRLLNSVLALVRRAAKGGQRFFLISVYLWVILALFALYKSILLPQESFLYGQGLALLNAFVLAKVMFFAEHAHIGENFETRPLVYPVLFKSGLFAVVLICFHIVEEIVTGALRGRTAHESIAAIGGGTLEGILSIGIIIFVALIPFFAFRELAKLAGPKLMHELLFVRRVKLVAARRAASAD